MTFSSTYTESNTYTLTHAKHVSAKVATDLRRMQRFYGAPSDRQIEEFEAELAAMLKAGYVDQVTYGFKRNGVFIEPTLRYTAAELSGAAAIDDDPGKVRPGADIAGASFASFLRYSSAWSRLSDAQQTSFEESLPISRTSGSEPGIAGYLDTDRTYSAGGRGLQRATVRSY
jgi:hypothetical protein